MNGRLFLYGLGIWIVATIALRLVGHYMLHPDHVVGTLVLFSVIFPLTAFLVRNLCKGLKLPERDWPAGAVTLLMPTLVLDPFSSTFFPIVFPNMDPRTAGLFGGLMLWCCAAALIGATFGTRRQQ
jgi:hypothetical protein